MKKQIDDDNYDDYNDNDDVNDGDGDGVRVDLTCWSKTVSLGQRKWKSWN